MPTLTPAAQGPTVAPTPRIWTCPAVPVVVVARLLAGLDPELEVVDILTMVICVTVMLVADEV